jgi:hypothetical protein
MIEIHLNLNLPDQLIDHLVFLIVFQFIDVNLSNDFKGGNKTRADMSNLEKQVT